MSLNKKVLSLAVLGVLASGSAFAANLSAPDGAIPAYFAQEIIAGPGADAVELGTSAVGATLNWNIGYSFSGGEVRYMRLQCSDNLSFNAASSVSSDNGSTSIGSVNGLGTNVLTFSLTAGATPVDADDVITVSGDHSITGTDQDVTCSTALYDQPSQAQAGGDVGRIAGTVFSGAYLSFVPSYELVNLNNPTNVAEVESDPAYSEFSEAESDSALSPTSAFLGQVAYRVKAPDSAAGQSAPFRIDGSEISLSDLFHADTSMTVTGDFSAFVDATSTPWGNPTVAANNQSAEITVGATGANGGLNGIFGVNGVDGAIQASQYSVTLNAVSAAPDVYAVEDITNVPLGEIVRNGTELQAPLVQRPNGWISRVVLTNTGSQDRSYSIGVQGEEGNVIGTGSAVEGTVGGNSTVVLDVTDILTSFTGSARATLNVTVNAPNEQIQGLYQIVNADSGSISNHVMVRPGTN